MIDPIVTETVLIFIIGLVVGSFLNVCIYRIPADLSIAYPPSRCGACQKKLSWYDNIPLLSFILLRGKCRYCSTKISFQYPAIELIFALLLLHVYRHFLPMSHHMFFLIYYGMFVACLLTATVIDLKHYIIPDEINFFGIIVALAGGVLYPPLVGQQTIPEALIHSVLGIGVGFASLRIVVFIGKIIFKRDAMGLGDPKFLAMIGAFIGFKLALLVIFLSSLIGAFIGSIFIMLIRKNKRDTVIPYGPFLALGAYIALYYGYDLINWYLSFIHIE